MDGTAAPNVLRRIARPAGPPAPLTPARALRLALARAAEGAIAMPLAALGIREEEGRLDDLLMRVEEGMMLLALREGGQPVGFAALDAEARSAVVEAQTLGRPSSRPSDPREPTAADAALARPLLAAFLAQAEEGTAGTPLEGWIRGPELGDRLSGATAAARLLPDGIYRAVRLTLDLGVGGRQGLLLLLIRLPPPPVLPAPASDSLDATVAQAVLRAQGQVTAVLHRLRLPLAEAEALVPGQVLALPGVTVGSVRLESGGAGLGSARLGQMSGMRAVRLEAGADAELEPSGMASEAPLLAEPDPVPEEPAWAPMEQVEAPDWEPPVLLAMG